MSLPADKRPAEQDENTRQVYLHSRGFAYLSLLIMVAIIGIATAAALQMGAIVQRRSAEEALLEIGAAFRAALISYANATPAGQNRSPASLQDLLKDPRYPSPRRHMRKLYADPITGKEEWGTVIAPGGGGIIGVYSLSTDHPIKIGNFSIELQNFEGKTSYREWIFSAAPIAQAAPPASPVLPAAAIP